ncbi:response regulator [Paenibacillus doosanensis]|uniref:response regulator transcription factor n=1 Tax=Paenibacillus doosanensis TaxID=1229154 RepID=UPI00217FDAFB|nr:response regulator [Paenibacillus doosanensis]MCS7460970.1 response regulator [Paenibacillus doosanensis]
MNLLIVDDELWLAEAVKSELPWEEMFGISSVSIANNIRQAKEAFGRDSVDLMICDIEMPQGSGLQLLAWVKEHHPRTETVFLTCHADFKYAQQAMQLGCLDYLLKPVSREELRQAVEKAIAQINRQSYLLEYSQLGEFWTKHQPLLVERFWLDVIGYSISPQPEAIRQAAAERNIPLREGMLFLPVLIQVQRYHKPLSPRDEKILEYGLCNCAEETLFPQEDGRIIVLSERKLLAVIPSGQGGHDMSRLVADCESFIAFGNRHLYCDVSCYAGEAAPVHQFADTVQRLFLLAQHNAASTGKVIVSRGAPAARSLSAELVEKIGQYVDGKLDQESLSRESVAQTVFLNPDYLDRIFKKETGMSVTAFLQQQRMRRAEELLSHTTMSVIAIGQQVGYSNVSHFSKRFKQHSGLSPLEFRRLRSLPPSRK